MDTKERSTHEVSEDVIELGVASFETKGPAGINEFVGTLMPLGISEE